jgi:aldose 1-epimerase
MNISRQVFGKTPNGETVDMFTLTNNKAEAIITNHGGTIVSLKVPDRTGMVEDVVLGYDTLDEYVKGIPYIGPLIGRFANRIRNGQFYLYGVKYVLAKNRFPHHLHGGIKGFDKAVWDAQQIMAKDSVGLKLTYLSRDGEEGYPGNLKCDIVYTLTRNNELKISYEAQTDKTTVINLTNHSYFNLAGHDSGDILGHELMIDADRFTVADDDLVPTGKIETVKSTPLDFTYPTPIGARIAQVKGGYDLNYMLNNSDGLLALAARVHESKTGRIMEVYTTQPGIQLYTGNFLTGSCKGKGTAFNKHCGFCLETQHFPDSPNHANFPSTELKPGQKYRQLTIYKFFTD